MDQKTKNFFQESKKKFPLIADRLEKLERWLEKTPEEKRVGLYEKDGWLVSTVEICDSTYYNYETAIQHADYNEGNLIIVDNYITLEEAEEGHHKWTTLVQMDPTPDIIRDNSSSEISMLLDLANEGEDWRVHKNEGFPDVIGDE